MTCILALRWPLLALLLVPHSATNAFAQAQAQPSVVVPRKFDPPRIIAVLRPNDVGNLDSEAKGERLYYINKGQDVTINRGDVLNVYREKKIYPAQPQAMRIFIGTMTIKESQIGSSMGHFTAGRKISLPLIKFKVPIKGDIVVPRLIIDSGVLFKPGEFSLSANAGDEFKKVADFIRNFSPNKLIIEGHTDADGDDAANQLLSEQRAEQVAKFLLEGYSFITPGMIEARGYGETQPIAPNDKPENKKLNRRIEAIIWE